MEERRGGVWSAGFTRLEPEGLFEGWSFTLAPRLFFEFVQPIRR